MKPLFLMILLILFSQSYSKDKTSSALTVSTGFYSVDALNTVFHSRIHYNQYFPTTLFYLEGIFGIGKLIDNSKSFHDEFTEGLLFNYGVKLNIPLTKYKKEYLDFKKSFHRISTGVIGVSLDGTYTVSFSIGFGGTIPFYHKNNHIFSFSYDAEDQMYKRFIQSKQKLTHNLVLLGGLQWSF